MDKKKNKDEILEQLWSMEELNQNSLSKLKENVSSFFSTELLNECILDGYVHINNEKHTVSLTTKGRKLGREIIRSHRIAERLVNDVLKENFELSACEFEHTINPELVDSICTLLGHPKKCPHGKKIPSGKCCRDALKTVGSSIHSIDDLSIGSFGRIAYIQTDSDKEIHRLDGLFIRPGAEIRLHQKHPTIVIECEGASIALGKDIAQNIKVWEIDGNKKQCPIKDPSRKRHGWFGGFGGRCRGQRSCE